MSEGSFWNKKTISIIAVTWILSLVTTLVVVNFVPILRTKSWHFVEGFGDKFQDEGGYQEFEFRISSEHWRVNWGLLFNIKFPLPEDAFFHASISEAPYGSAIFLHVTREDLFARGVGNDTTQFAEIQYLTGSGEMRLRVSGAWVRWSIVIEEYR